MQIFIIWKKFIPWFENQQSLNFKPQTQDKEIICHELSTTPKDLWIHHNDFLYLEMNQFIKKKLEIYDSIYDILDICDCKMIWSLKTSDIE
jgi:hypothetical protein